MRDRQVEAKAESIMSVYSRTKSTAEYISDGLRLVWNQYMVTGKKQELPEGYW